MMLETIVDNLRQGYKQLKPGSMLSMRQLMDERRTHPDLKEGRILQNTWFYAADTHGYFVTPNDVEWAIVSDTENSPLFRNIDVAFGELLGTDNYRPSDEESLVAKTHPDTLVVPMSKLRLLGKDRQFRCLAIRTSDGLIRTSPDSAPEQYEAPTKEEQDVKNRLGYTIGNLTMLKESPQRIRETRIWSLNPGYVQEEAGTVPGRSSLWRASWLNIFNNLSYANANERLVNSNGALRGVRRVVAVGDAPKNLVVPDTPSTPQEVNLANYYDALLADPRGAVAALDDTRTSGLMRIVADYLASQVQ